MMQTIRRHLLLCSLGLLLPALASAASVSMRWDPGVGVVPDGYIIERREGSGAFTEIGRTPEVTYTDAQAPTTPPVCYRVKAQNALFTSGPSNEVCLTMPGAPTHFTVTITVTVSGAEVQNTPAKGTPTGKRK